MDSFARQNIPFSTLKSFMMFNMQFFLKVAVDSVEAVEVDSEVAVTADMVVEAVADSVVDIVVETVMVDMVEDAAVDSEVDVEAVAAEAVAVTTAIKMATSPVSALSKDRTVTNS